MELKKLTKTQVVAKQKRLSDGKKMSIRLVSSNFNPENVWGAFYDLDVKKDTDLQSIIDTFLYYNCINNETGKRVHFYLIDEVEA